MVVGISDGLYAAEIIIAFSFHVVKIFQVVTLPVVKAIAGKLPPSHRLRLLRMVDKVAHDTANTMAIKAASVRQEKLRTACTFIKLGIEQLKSGCHEWDEQWKICEEPVSNSAKKGSGPSWEMIRSCKYYEQAIHHFELAELKAMEVLNESDDSSLAPIARIEALDILLFCQVILHWNDRRQWFRMWQRIFENFVADQNLLKKSMGKARHIHRIFSAENDSIRQRMIKLVEVYAQVIISSIIDDPSLKPEAEKFIQFFNDSLKDIEVHKDWRPLLGPDDARFGDHYWFRGNWGMLTFTPLPNGDKFLRLTGVKQLTWVPPMYLYAVTDPKNELVSIEMATPTNRRPISEGKWKLLGYADEKGLLYASNQSDNNIQTVDVNSNLVKARTSRTLPVNESRMDDYVFRVASNGAILAYHKMRQSRYVSFDLGDWIEMIDPNDKKSRATVTTGDLLMAVGSDEEKSLLRLSVRSKKGLAKLQVERIQISKGCAFKKFTLDSQLHEGCLISEVGRIPSKGSQEIFLFLMGYKEPKTNMTGWSRKPQIAKLKIKIEDGQVKNIKTVYQNDIHDVSSVGRAAIGNGTVFCEGQ